VPLVAGILVGMLLRGLFKRARRYIQVVGCATRGRSGWVVERPRL